MTCDGSHYHSERCYQAGLRDGIAKEPTDATPSELTDPVAADDEGGPS